MKSSIAIAALVATTIGFGAVLPAVAQDTAPPAPTAQQHQHNHDRTGGPDRGRFMERAPAMGPAGLLMLACSPRGAETLELALVRMSYRLGLTADQQPLFDAFRTKALTTETSFADSCKSALPDRSANARPDMLSRLKAGLAVDQARLTALNAVLPDFEALYNTLTDAQKAKLLPHRMGMGGMKGMGRGMFHHWQNGKGGPGADHTQAAPAPSAT